MKKKGIIIGIASVILVTGIMFGVTEVQAQICEVTGCTERSEHKHYSCEVAGCTERSEHEHYSCEVTGCMEQNEHEHYSCEAEDCTEIGEHSHKKENHHSSYKKKGQH